MAPSGHKAFLVQNASDVELLLMHNRTFAAEYVPPLLTKSYFPPPDWPLTLSLHRIGHAVSSRKRIDILAKAKSLGLKVTNPKVRVATET